MADQIIVNSGFRTWSVDQLPDLKGKTYLITGGNSGLGFETAKHLGKKGARLIFACRSVDKAEKARAEVMKATGAEVDLVRLDLSDLSSVREAANEVKQRYDKLDALINNAGIMQCPQQKTKDGFEMQVGTNHLGHFLLSALLLDRVEAAAGRIVTVSSIVTRMGQLDLDDLMLEKSYTPSAAYINSKISNLMFALELDRRLQDAGSPAISIACHPGYSNTNLQSTGPSGFLNLLYKVTNPLFAQSPSMGAEPTALAAAGREAKRGAYYGPQKMREARGPTGDAKVPEHVLDRAKWRRLWDLSEELVGLKWDFSSKPANIVADGKRI